MALSDLLRALITMCSNKQRVLLTNGDIVQGRNSSSLRGRNTIHPLLKSLRHSKRGKHSKQNYSVRRNFKVTNNFKGPPYPIHHVHQDIRPYRHTGNSLHSLRRGVVGFAPNIHHRRRDGHSFVEKYRTYIKHYYGYGNIFHP